MSDAIDLAFIVGVLIAHVFEVIGSQTAVVVLLAIIGSVVVEIHAEVRD